MVKKSEFLEKVDFFSSSGPHGVLEAIDNSQIGFHPARVYWIRGVPENGIRGNHAHKELRQVFVCLTGSFLLELYDSKTRHVQRIQQGNSFRLQPGLWRVLSDFASNTIVLVICSHPYDETDYIRSWADFLTWKSRNER